MKRLSLTPITRIVSTLALAATACATFGLAPMTASAQSTDGTTTIDGDFKFSDQSKGTFVETITISGAVSTDVTIYTRKSDNATSTDNKTTTTNADGSRLVTFSHNDFGATAQFTSSKTVTPEKHGEAFGNGTFTNADGTSGVFTTLETRVTGVEAISATYTTSTGVTQDLHVTERELRFTGVKAISLNPNGTVTTEVHSLFVTHKK